MPKVLRHIYTLLVVLLTFVLFRAETFTQAWMMITEMFSFSFTDASLSAFVSQLTPWFIVMFIFALICIFPKEKFFRTEKSLAAAEKLKYLVFILLFVFCAIRISSAAYNPFIYFRF